MRFVCAYLAALFFVPLVAVAKTTVELDAAPAYGVLQANRPQTISLKIGLRGLGAFEHRLKRSAVNLALVLDRSGSMEGEKIERAKQAAREVVYHLQGDDIFSFVAFSNEAAVLVPATRVNDRTAILRSIDSIRADGSTALYAGVSRGAREIEKFLSRTGVNRVILISDGEANIGPSSPQELADLGRSLRKDGMSVTTVGLGLNYNEDLMVRLAQASDGNHAFVERATDLATVFNRELGDVFSVVANNLQIELRLSDGFRAVRTLGREATITGNVINAALGQVYANQEKYFLLELEAPARPAGSRSSLAKVKVRYTNSITGETETAERAVDVSFSDSSSEIDAHINRAVLSDYYLQLTNDDNRRAIALRDQGKVEEAEAVLRSNSDVLGSAADKFRIPSLKEKAEVNLEQSRAVTKGDWNRTRKSLSEYQSQVTGQQGWKGGN